MQWESHASFRKHVIDTQGVPWHFGLFEPWKPIPPCLALRTLDSILHQDLTHMHQQQELFLLSNDSRKNTVRVNSHGNGK